MAIHFARPGYVQRSRGHNAVHKAGYNCRERFRCERTGETRRAVNTGTLLHHEVLLPAGADPAFGNAEVLWNAVEWSERRKDSVLAREIVLALPSDAGLTDAHRLDMARRFANEYFVSKGLAVQLDIHRPHATATTDTEKTNYHAHLLITTRRLGQNGFARHKATDLDPQVRTIGRRRVVTEAQLWGDAWAEFQTAWFERHNLAVRVRPIAEFPGEHLGPRRFLHPYSHKVEHAHKMQILNSPAIDRMRVAVTRRLALLDHVPSGHRLRTVDEVARDQSKDYARFVDRAEWLERKIFGASAALVRWQAEREDAEWDFKQRWRDLGTGRRATDRIGRLFDVRALRSGRRDHPEVIASGIAVRLLRDDILRASDQRRKRATSAIAKINVQIADYRTRLDRARRQRHRIFEHIRPAAENDLSHRQRLAERSRDLLRQWFPQGPEHHHRDEYRHRHGPMP